MKRTAWLVVSLLISVFSQAQTQHGIVKTKGRLGSDNKVISGVRLQGVTIQMKGCNAVLSQKDGRFSLIIPTNENAFFLEKVEKMVMFLQIPTYCQTSMPIRQIQSSWLWRRHLKRLTTSWLLCGE